MTDNEIIKAMKSAIYRYKDATHYVSCIVDINILKNVLNLINRQKAEIEKIKIKLKYYLETNEENGVVYIPKFIIDNLVKEMMEVNENENQN